MQFLRNFKIIIPLLIGVVLLAVPLTRRDVALQMGWQRTEAGSILPRSHALKDDPVWRSDWFQLLEKLQHHGEIPNEGDQYLRSHPQDVALLSARIRYLLSICPMPRRAGELDISRSWLLKQGYLPDTRDAARRKVLLPLIRELSLLGQQQEPQNAFFDWILSLVAYAQYQDDLGWRYLQSAGRKTQFDVHVLDLAHDVLRRERRVLGRPLLWEEKYAAQIYFPANGIFRTHVLGEWLRWKIIQKMRAGEFQQALQIQEVMSRLGNLITREAKLRFTASLGNILLSQAYFASLELPIIPEIGPPPFRPKMTQKERFYKVARFADAHHLPQLHQIGQDYLRSRRYIRRAQNRAPELFSGSITKTQFTIMRLSWIFGVLLLSLIGGAALGRFCLFWAKPLAQAPPRLARFAAGTSWFLLIIPCAVLFGFAFSGDRWSSNIWVWDLSAVGALLIPLILAIAANLLIVLLLPWRRILENQAVSLWTPAKVLLAAIAFLLAPPFVYFLTIIFPFFYEDVIASILDFPCRVYFYYVLGMHNPYAVQTFIPWEYRGLLIHLTTFLIFAVIYSLLIWLIIRHFRAQKMRGYWRNAFYFTRCSLGSFAWLGIILYGQCMGITVAVRTQVDSQPPPIASSENLALHADRRDLTGTVDPQEFYTKWDKF